MIRKKQELSTFQSTIENIIIVAILNTFHQFANRRLCWMSTCLQFREIS